MKRTVAALALSGTALLGLGLTACSSEQSGGNSNPDSQVEQPPLPDQTEPREQGADPSQGPDAGTSDAADDTGDNGSGTEATPQ